MKIKSISLFLLLFAFTSFSAPAVGAEIASEAELTEKMTCLCGCGQTIKNCPHENCGFAIPARTKIEAMLKEGKSADEILQVFLEQYGDEILAAPPKKGFNLLGYIMPFAALILATGIIMLIIRGWAARGVADEEKTLPQTKKDFGSAIDKKIEKELEEMD